MVSLVFLGLAIACALISRILLLTAAANSSAGWAFGLFLPFGPLFFRLNYPEEARNSYLFRVATLLCVFGFVISQPRMTLHLPKIHSTAVSPRLSKQTVGYAMEKPGTSKKATGSPTPASTPTLEQRRAANATVLERLRGTEAELNCANAIFFTVIPKATASTRLISSPPTRRSPKPPRRRMRSPARSSLFLGRGARARL